MKRSCAFIMLISSAAFSQTPSILLEACNQMEPASKRLECLKAASGHFSSRTAAQPLAGAARAPSFSPNTGRAASPATGQTCFVGPRGGTYTITASGRKNYGGC